MQNDALHKTIVQLRFFFLDFIVQFFCLSKIREMQMNEREHGDEKKNERTKRIFMYAKISPEKSLKISTLIEKLLHHIT